MKATEKTEKKKRGPHPGKGLPIGHAKCDYCRKPLRLVLSVGFQGQRFHPVDCAAKAIAEQLGVMREHVIRHFGKGRAA